MRDVIATAAGWAAEGVGCGRATVVRAIGPSPFRVGSTLVVADDGRLAGSISAGCVEGAAVEAIRAARHGHYRQLVRYGVTDELALEAGLICGGTIDVLIEPDIAAEALSAATEERSVAIATPLPVGREPAPAPRLVCEPSGLRSSSLGDVDLDGRVAELARLALRLGAPRAVSLDEREIYIDVLAAPPTLVIVGAGEIAVHLVRLASAYGLRSVVIDARSAFATRDRFPDADDLLIGWADHLADRAGMDEGAYVVVLSHDPKFDDPALLAALRRGARYVGALGSRRTHAARLDRLRAADIAEEDLSRIHAPIGLDLAAKDPASIALGILAEIVAEANRTAGMVGDSVMAPEPGLSVG